MGTLNKMATTSKETEGVEPGRGVGGREKKKGEVTCLAL